MHIPQRKQYLYVRVVKAKDLHAEDVTVTGGCDRYVEARLGDYKGTTFPLALSERNAYPEWNQVFAFLMDVDATMLEVTVKDTDVMKDDFKGWVLFDLGQIPKKVQPDPQWHELRDRKGDKVKGKLMLSVWWGTQTDEAFHEAISARVVDGPTSIRSRAYLSPKLWYLRVNVIEAQDLIPTNQTSFPEVYVKVVLGNQSLRTRISSSKSRNPVWNEELMFVAAEPFEEHLILSVEDGVAPNVDEVLGRCVIPLHYVERRLEHRTIRTRWFSLEKFVMIEGQQTKQAKFASRIRMGICLEGGYHVLAESTCYSSHFRPTAKQLWKECIGKLELVILSAQGLPPIKTKDGATTYAYCVAKYGVKWVKTKTIMYGTNPKWNEEYNWEVHDPCTVLTIGVFRNFDLQSKDTRIGKVRIRVSTLETGRIYIHSYPILVLHPSGVKKMGEINLAVRFTCSSLVNMMRMYTQPLFPNMHYTHPLTVTQLDSLRHQATQIISMRLSRADPPLRKEVVEYMLDVGCDMWSMRRSQANVLRFKEVFDGLFEVGKWFRKNPIITIIIYYIVAMHPELILSSIFLFLFVKGVWNYRYRPRDPPHMDTRLSCADNAHHDELDEEFDTYPTSRHHDIISMRYDRLRRESGRIQTWFGDIATQGERLQSLLSWRDPVATALFVIFCLLAALVLYAIPFHAVAIQTAISLLYRHNKLPLVPLNFFRRLPTRIDSML